MIDIILAQQKATLQNSLGELREALKEDDNWRALSALESVGEAAGGVPGYAWIARREELVEALSGNPFYALYCELDRVLSLVSAQLAVRRSAGSIASGETSPIAASPDFRFEPRRERIAERIASLTMPPLTVDGPANGGGLTGPDRENEAQAFVKADQSQTVSVPPTAAIAAAVQSILASVVVPQLAEPPASVAAKTFEEPEVLLEPVLEDGQETEAESTCPDVATQVAEQETPSAEAAPAESLPEAVVPVETIAPGPDLTEALNSEPLETEQAYSAVIADGEVLSSDQTAAEETIAEELAPEVQAPEVPADEPEELPATLLAEAGEDEVEAPADEVPEADEVEAIAAEVPDVEAPVVDEDFNFEGNAGENWEDESEAEVSIVPRGASVSVIDTAGDVRADDVPIAEENQNFIDENDDISGRETETLEQRLQRLDFQSENLVRPKKTVKQETPDSAGTPSPQSWLEIMRARRASAAQSLEKAVPAKPKPHLEAPKTEHAELLDDASEAQDFEAEVKIVRRKLSAPASSLGQAGRQPDLRGGFTPGDVSQDSRAQRSFTSNPDESFEPSIGFASKLEEASVEIVRRPSGAKAQVEKASTEDGGQAPEAPGSNRFFRSLTGE
jgi:hypothetical protein